MFNFLKSLDKKQESAIDVNMSIAVSAGAGSGKTRVITARILNLLKEGYNIDQIVAITFTEKATLEMKKRVREALLEEIEQGDEEKKKLLQIQLDRLSNCKISTIHAFCFNIIKENAAMLGMDFNVELILGIDQQFILRTILKEELEKLQEDKALYSILLDISKGNPLKDTFIDDLVKVRSAIYNNYSSIYGAFEASNKDIINKAIFEVITRADEKYKEYKNLHNLIDNDDLLTLAQGLLEDDEIRAAYRERYKLFLVDEFQDTNEIQRKILYSLVSDEKHKIEPSKLFIVGDKKQGIYSFRGANCDIFNKVTQAISSLHDTSGKKVLLDTCYRSKENIVKGINEIFSESLGDYEALQFNKKEATTDRDLKRIIYLKADSTIKDDSIKTYVDNVITTSNSEELEDALQFIRDNRNNFTQSENKNYAIAEAVSLLKAKGYNYEDICILVRTSNAIQGIETELKKVSVPYCVIGGRNFYKKEEIQLLINLYEIAIRGFENLKEDKDSTLILKVLRSFAFNIPDQLLFKVINSRLDLTLDTTFIKLLEIYIDSYKGNEEIEPLTYAYSKLRNISLIGKKYSTYTLFNKIIEELDLDTAVLSLEDGTQKFRNIEKLLEEAYKFDKKEIYEATQFLNYLRFVETGDKETAAATLDTEESKAVKIMTIHMSKGLEFKAVIFPESDYKLTKTQKPSVVYHNENIIVKEVCEGRDDIEALNYTNYDSANKAASMEEEKRVLYVAMTRAEEYFIFTGNGPTAPKKDVNTYDEVLYNAVSKNPNVEKYLEIKPASEVAIISNNEANEEISINQEGIISKLSYKVKVNNKNNISASTIMKYKDCPRKYYYEKILKLDGSYFKNDDESGTEEKVNILQEDNTNLSGAALGTLVHEVLESFNGELMEVNNLKDENLRKYIENFNTIEKKNKEEKEGFTLIYSANEIPFTYALENNKDITVTGFIDRIDLYEKDNKLIAEVIDYKTNKLFTEEDAKRIKEHYEPQLLLYGKVVEQLLGKDNKKVDIIIPKLYLLAKGNTISYDYNEALVNELFLEINEYFNKDFSKSKEEDFKQNKGKQCEFCNYCKRY